MLPGRRLFKPAFNRARIDARMRLWAGYMEPPGKHGGPVLAFADYSLNETYHDPPMLDRAGPNLFRVRETNGIHNIIYPMTELA